MYNHASQSNFRRIILFVLVFCSFVSFGQNAKFSVSGSVLDEKNSSMPFASVALYRADSSLFGGSTTEINGSFKINNVPSGDYFLKISFVGYNAFSKEITVNQNLNLGKMQLSAGVELDAFVVRENYIPVQTIEDTVIFAADAFSPPEGSALEELLKRFPGAEVDKDGKITVNGKEISKILVNGKKFFDDDPKIASKNLPANIVDKVQFFEKASDQSQFSGIDDGESENVINLITKPGMQKGVFGNVTLAGGTNMPPMLGTWSDWKFENDFRFNNSISLNYFKDSDQLSLVGSWNNCNNVGFTDMMNSSSSMMFGGRRRGGGGNTSAGIANSASIGLNFSKEFSPKVTAGGDYQFGFTKNFAETETFRENLYNSGNTFYNEDNTATTTSMQHRLRFEVNYKIDTNNTLNFRPNISFANSSKDQIGTHSLFDAENSLLNTGIEESFSKSWSFESRLEVQYQHKFQKPRRTLWISLNGGLRTGKGLENNITQNIFYDGGEESDSINKETNSVSNRYNYAAYFGYTEPLTKRATLELRYSFSQTNESKDQKALNYDYLTGDYSLLDTNYSTFYSNHFMQHRLEARVQWQFEKLNFSIGMGAYPSISDNILSSGEPYKQMVWNYSPSARLQFRPSKTETLRLFYNGRATQPSMSQLQPVPDNTDALDIKLGNLDLLPSFQHGLRTIYNKTFKTTASLFAMLMGNVVQNGIAGVTITDPSLYPELKLAELPKGAQYTRYENIPLTYNARANATFNTPIVTSKFNVSITGNVAYTNNKSIIDKKINTTDNISGGGMLKFTFRITTFDVSLNGRANVTKAMYSLQPERNMLYNTLSGGIDFNWTIFKGFILSSDFAYQKQNGYSDNYNPQTFMWNAQISYTFGKRNEWSMRLRAIDLLNNNVNVVRNVNSQYYEDIRYNSLGRYVLLGITYNLNAKLAKEENDKAIENFRSGNPPPRGRRW